MNGIGSIFILIGTIFIFLTIKSTRENIASHGWPQGIATLKHIEIEKRIREGDSDDYYRRYTSYFCILTYQYEAGGNIFTAKQAERGDTRENALALSQAHRIGETALVHYQPDYPDNYRFDLAPAYRGLLWLLPFCAFSGFGLAAIYIGRRFFT